MDRRLAGLLGVAACGGFNPTVAPLEPELAQRATAACLEACEVDPTPAAPGYFLGVGLTPETCQADTTRPGDADLDGLVDSCEQELAQAFAPEFSYWSGDEVGREPYWVARWLDSATVRVMYLMAYYVDLGHRIFGYNHYGDAEKVFLDVRYNPATSHWVLHWVLVTAHSSMIDAVGEGVRPPDTYRSPVDGRLRSLTYAGTVGGHVRVWVAQRSHGSYLAPDECENGAVLRTDTCASHDALTRDLPRADRNLGSRAHPFHDCVATSNPRHPYYGAGRLECFWTDRPFRGWYPEVVGRASGGAYTGPLEFAGF